jgi:hypothetical protein
MTKSFLNPDPQSKRFNRGAERRAVLSQRKCEGLKMVIVAGRIEWLNVEDAAAKKTQRVLTS